MVQKVTLKLSGMHCSSCAMNIDGSLEDAAGVQEASTSFAKQAVEVRFDEEKISLQRIKDIIKQAGYQAEEK